MRIVLLDSWHTRSQDGSGTAVGIATLERALTRAGHEVSTLRPRVGAGLAPVRHLFNLRLPARLEGLDPETLVVGFDVDGVRWGESPRRRGRYVVALKGVARDEARFATSRREARALEALARREERNARSADRVLVPSAYSAEVVRRMYGVSDAALRIVPEPIDLSEWEKLRSAVTATADRAARPRPPTILSVARQYPRKDTATLLRALPRVREAVPEVRLRVVGGGPELPRLRELASASGLDGSVTFLGALASHEEVRRAYFAADVFCLPSRQEGFGIVFLEAMAAGVPVVAARAGAVPEVVQDRETGVLVAPGDADALADALIALLRDPAKRARMSAAAIARVRRYDLPEVADAFLAAALDEEPRVR